MSRCIRLVLKAILLWKFCWERPSKAGIVVPLAIFEGLNRVVALMVDGKFLPVLTIDG